MKKFEESKVIRCFVNNNVNFYFADFFEYHNFDEQNSGNRVTEKTLYNALGAALTNSKDWDGFRSIRSNQRKQ